MNKMTREEVCEFLSKTRIEHEPTRFVNVEFIGEDLRDIAFMDCDFVDCSFIRCDFSGSNFSHCSFTNVRMKYCDLTETNFAGSHFSEFFFSLCEMNNTACCLTVFKHGGFEDCYINNTDMFNSYHLDTSVTRGCLLHVNLEYSTMIDVNYVNTAFDKVNYEIVECHHITMENVSLKDTDIKPLGDSVTVYGASDSDEIAVHLVINTKNGDATVTLAEEV